MAVLNHPVDYSTIRKDQVPAACAVLVRSFFNYPLVEHLFPDIAERKRALPVWAGYPVKYSLRYGQTYVTPGLEGVAVWINPENAHMTIPRHIISGTLAIPFRIGLAAYKRMVDLETYMEERWRQVGPQKRWYLWIMGVDPAFQRQGYGEALVRVGTAQADQSGLPCCLETHNEQNVAFYRKFGFEPVFTGVLPGHDLPVWMMVRQPR